MPTSYVTTADFDAMLEPELRRELFATNGGYDETVFTRAAQLASAMARSAAKNAGYLVDDETTDDMLRLAALSLLVRMAYARKQRSVPDELTALFGVVPDAIRNGDLPLIETEVDAGDAVGGVEFTPSSALTTSDRARPARLKNLGKLV